MKKLLTILLFPIHAYANGYCEVSIDNGFELGKTNETIKNLCSDKDILNYIIYFNKEHALYSQALNRLSATKSLFCDYKNTISIFNNDYFLSFSCVYKK